MKHVQVMLKHAHPALWMEGLMYFYKELYVYNIAKMDFMEMMFPTNARLVLKVVLLVLVLI